MTDIGESVVVQELSLDHDPNTCCFCAARKQEDRENDLTDYAAIENDSGKLKGSLQQVRQPRPEEVKLTFKQGTAVCQCEPHHLLPGNESFKKWVAKTNKPYLKPGKGPDRLGFDINCADNGVWLPGKSQVDAWGTKKPWKPAGNPPDQYINPADSSEAGRLAFATAAIEKYGAQFHDRHPAYSAIVVQALQKLEKKLERNEVGCPQAKQKRDEGAVPDVAVLLIRIAHRFRAMLSGGTAGWKSQVFTSRFSAQYMADKRLGG